MRADTKALTGASPEVAPLLGTWINAKRDTDHVVKVKVSEEDGTLRVRLHGSSDWGETEATPYAFTGTTDVAGFHARYGFDKIQVEIAANVKLGILVIQTYTTFEDDRVSQFSREFFYRSTSEPPAGEVAKGIRFLSGAWVNTNHDTKWIKSFTIEDHTLHIEAATTPTDWGETTITTYLDNAGEPAFRAEYDLGQVEALLAGNTGKSIIIIAAFIRLKTGEQANTFSREFFVPR
jgi:hypothetical protein